jgi:hypothetical protein
MKMFRKIADQRIVEAMERGEFDNLEGAGKRLDLEDDALVPVEYRLAHRVLKNAGYVPEEVRLRNDIAALESLVYEDCEDETRAAALRRLELLRLRLERRSGQARPLHLEDAYRERVVSKLAKPSDEEPAARKPVR